MRRGSRASFLAIVALAGCGSAADSIVVVRVEADQVVSPIVQLRVGVMNRGLMDTKVFAQADGTPMIFPKTLALIVPTDRQGPIEVDVAGLGDSGRTVAHGRRSGDLLRSKRIDLVVALMEGAEEGCPAAPSSCPPASDDAGASPGRDAGAEGAPDSSVEVDSSGMHDSASTDALHLLDSAGSDRAPTTGRAVGEDCEAPDNCASGHCVDGVCCQEACTGTCFSCNLPGKRGLCTPVPPGQDPRGACAPGPAPCGGDGACDGAGACRQPAAGTRCAPPRCVAGQVTDESTCDGAGRCLAPAPRPCGSGCAADGTSCTTPPAKKPTGEVCAGGDECSSGYCIDGVCCASDCSTGCYSCSVPGHKGQCVVVPDGQDPGNDCTEDGGQPCGRDGFCDGTGGCRMRKAGTVCAAGTCTSATNTSARTCDGLGNCQSASTTSCLPAACNASGSGCDTTCSNHPEGCPAGQVCSTLCGMPAICCRP